LKLFPELKGGVLPPLQNIHQLKKSVDTASFPVLLEMFIRYNPTLDPEKTYLNSRFEGLSGDIKRARSILSSVVTFKKYLDG